MAIPLKIKILIIGAYLIFDFWNLFEICFLIFGIYLRFVF